MYYRKVMVNIHWVIEPLLQRLVGATLLVFANKQDLPGAMSADEIREVSQPCMLCVVDDVINDYGSDYE